MDTNIFTKKANLRQRKTISELQNQILVTMTENDKNKKLLQTKSENIQSLQNENESLRNGNEANDNKLNEATQVLRTHSNHQKTHSNHQKTDEFAQG